VSRTARRGGKKRDHASGQHDATVSNQNPPSRKSLVDRSQLFSSENAGKKSKEQETIKAETKRISESDLQRLNIATSGEGCLIDATDLARTTHSQHRAYNKQKTR
jgi:hypothetical protein